MSFPLHRREVSIVARLANYARLFKPSSRARWSIGIYAGPGPLELKPHPALAHTPVLTTESLGGMRASGVADPFMMRHGDEWLMFFEIENLQSGNGEIGLARSTDCLSWKFDRVVLAENFHMSYPQVLEFEGEFYMVPETSSVGSLRLYKAAAFPARWQFQCELIRANIADATIFQHEGRWWIIANEGFRASDEMTIYHADRLEGPWLPHAANPILKGDRRASRPAGKVVRHGGALIRFAQDYEGSYGRCVRAFRIDHLDTQQYVETPMGDSEVLGGTGEGWNSGGMHHVDAHQISAESWIACVDGRENAFHLPAWEAGLRKLANAFHRSP